MPKTPMRTEPMNDLIFPLDERNLAHVLTAMSLTGIADNKLAASPDSRCWWTEAGFHLRVPFTQMELLEAAHAFVLSIRWVPGIGRNEQKNGSFKTESSPHHGVFTAAGGYVGNPLLSYHDQGASSSIFKTFSGQQSPATPLERQQDARWLKPPAQAQDWMFQLGYGVASWKFDSRVAGHAYDQGFGSNEDQSGESDPYYPAIELLSIAGAAFFIAPQAWLVNEDAMTYCIWRTPIPLPLASLAIAPVPSSGRTNSQPAKAQQPASLLDGLDTSCYRLATRGNAYGKGAAYRHFPEATLITSTSNH